MPQFPLSARLRKLTRPLLMSANILVWADIPVTNLARATRFYSVVLGKPVFEVPGMELSVLPNAEVGASGCLAVMKDNIPAQKGPLIYLSVEGRLNAAIEAVQSNGGEILQPRESIAPHGFRALILDSEGNRIALHSQTE